MARVRVEGFTISLDGYGAGPNQDIDNPLGVGAEELHQWLLPTRTFQRALFGKDGGMFGPIRGACELHIVIAPVLLGRGESLFERVNLRALGYKCVESVASEKATHIVLRR
jgi:hypothetical protein